MLNARKREASDPILPTRQPKHLRVEEGTGSIPAGLTVHSGLAARWCDLAREVVELASETLRIWGSPPSPPGNLSIPARPRRFLPSPPHSRSRTAHTVPQLRRLLPSYTPGPNEFHLHAHRTEPEPTSLPSSLVLDRYSMQISNPTDGSSSSMQSATTGITSISHSTPLPCHQTGDDLLADSMQLCQKAEERHNILKQRRSKEHIYARKHKAKVREDRVKDREAVMKELYVLKRANGFESNYEDFKSYINYQARLQHLDDRDTFSPSASLTDLRLKEDTPSLSHRHSFDYADVSFLENAKNKLLRTLANPLVKPFSHHDWLRQEARKKDKEIERRFRPLLPESLPPHINKQVNDLLAKKGVISKIAREQVSDRDLSRLLPCQWLNDELINFYGAMILERSEAHKENPVANGRKQPLNVHYFNTFFWSKLQGEGYERARLAKWTKKLDIFSKDIILVPINHNNSHWSGAAINFRRKRIESYDSMNLDRHQVFKGLRHYLDLENQNKKKKPFDFTGWTNYGPNDTPQQENGYDCGVFTCQFLEALSRGEETFSFGQRDMAYLRRRMIWEIGNAKFLDVP